MLNKRPLWFFRFSLAAGLALGLGAAPAWARPVTSRTTASAIAVATPRDPARAFIKVELHLEKNTRGLFVGQAVPITIRAYFLGGTGVTLNGRPTIASDALLLSDLSPEPKQSPTQIRGLPYTMLSWTGVLTAIKDGAALTEVELPVQLSYREAPRLHSLTQRSAPDPADQNGQENQDGQDNQDGSDGNDAFASLLRGTPFASDPFFAQMFKGHDPLRGMFDDLAGTVRQRALTLRDTAGTLPVSALPPNPPPGFSGAVGTFAVSAALDDQALRAGEPATLHVAVRGLGSFSRLSIASLPPSDQLNTYGVTSTFNPGPGPLAGEKVFAETIVPRQAGRLTVPAVTLSYFDPGERRYVTRRTAPLTVDVSGNAGDHPPLAAAAGAESGGEQPAALGAPPSAVVGAVPDVVRSSLTPALHSRWFWASAIAIGLLALALALLGLAYRKGALGRVMTDRRLRHQLATQCRNMKAAAASGDATALFGAGRRALQARLGAVWGVPAEAIAAADVTSRLGPRGQRICAVFEKADRHTYSGGRTAANEDLTHWQSLITDELGSLEATS